MQKLLIILAAVLSIASIGLGYVNRTHFVALKNSKITAESDRDAALKKVAAQTAELKAAEEKVAASSKDLEKNTSELSDLHTRLDKATSDQADLQKQLAKKDGDMAQQKTDLDAKDKRIAELEAKTGSTNQPSPSQQDDLMKQLQEKEALIASFQSKNKEMETQLSDLRQREAQRKAKIMRNGLEGRVLAVNSSYNFVVISLGDRNGVIGNSELLISRGPQLIGKVRITEVEPTQSIADIVVNSVRPGMSVRPGDTVIYSGPEENSEIKL